MMSVAVVQFQVAESWTVSVWETIPDAAEVVMYRHTLLPLNERVPMFLFSFVLNLRL
jgi:hypothetical protein